jgi:hypothetical protein
MKRLLCLGVAAILAIALSACGGGGDSRNIFVAQILSDQQADGDIAFDPVLSLYTITNGPDTVFFGIDEENLNLPEFRAFLDFPLDGSTGDDVVPLGAPIRSATIEVFVNQVGFATTIPTLVELVQYPISGLRVQDFDSLPLESRSLDFFGSDLGNYVAIDVTPLMGEAQRLRLTDFQVRFLLDFVPGANGLVGIEDRPAITLTAPLLIVEYY